MVRTVSDQADPDPSCPLCAAPAAPFREIRGRRYHGCPLCGGIFLDPAQRLGSAEEKGRYEKHRNDAEDPGYRSFVSPLTEAVRREVPPSSPGLDYGAGRSSAVAALLREAGYRVEEYDPYFADRPELLGRRYGFVALCEVAEHFYRPGEEFARLRDLLAPGGRLYCMTALYEEGLDFASWHYKDDPTHVFIYRSETLGWIAGRLGFAGLRVEGRLAVFSR